MAKTMLFMLLDESGSMTNLRKDVIGTVNTFIEEQRKLPDPAVMAIACFGDHIQGGIKFIRPMIDLKEIAPLTDVDFVPNGWTPLLDATGGSIVSLDADWAREKPDRCVFSTFTDGQENASKEYTLGKIKSLIEAREKSGLWVFQFLGANIDSFATAQQMGYNSSHTANYTASSKGFAAAGETLSGSVGMLRNASDEVFVAAAAGAASIGLGGDIQEDGSVTNQVDVKVTATTHPGFGAFDTRAQQLTRPSSTVPPVAALAPEVSWTPPTSSALFDPKVEAWKPPV
jgi:hypothetical protein